VVFVPFTAPGDVVRIRILEEDKRYAQAELLEVVEPSPHRQNAPCPVFGRCGGCQWQHIPYSLQWETKSGGVFHALKRVQIPLPESVDLIPADQIWNYRNRIQLRGFGEELGFFAAKSHERVSIEDCKIARNEVNAALPAARAEGKLLPEPFKLEIEVLDDGSVRKTWNSRHAAAGFRQVHDQQNERLRAWVSGLIAPGGRVLDLYGGSGNLGSPVSLTADIVDCVDTTAPEGTVLPNFPNLKFHRSPVAKWLKRRAGALKGNGGEYSSAILDPPREGLADDFNDISASLEKLGVRELICVGCDPDSWARDLSRFGRRGWKVQRVGVLDLFPQTPHVESLALLKL
jgi:23S rRNA (uracil1939-C5)-methyltransferase